MVSQRFFISFNSADRLKAHWIAWSLKEAGHEVAVHDWEIPAGGNAPLWMNAKLAWADRLIAVISPDYAPARYSPMEWAFQLWDDADGTRGSVIPVIVRPTSNIPPLLRGLRQMDLTNCSEDEAQRRLVQGVDMPAPPERKPAFEKIVGEAPDSQHAGPSEKPSFVGTLSEGTPRLKLAYGNDRTSDRGNHKMAYVNGISEGDGDVVGAQVVIDKSMFKARGSDKWVRTRITARHIMSWANVPDGRPEKYAPRQIAKGDNIVDFITCPAVNDQGEIWVDSQGRRAFVFRIDPDHFKAVFPVFSDEGTYSFVMQFSAPNVLQPPTLTLLVEWDGQKATIQSEDDQVLEIV
jgi:hypothetical protein